MQNEIIVKIKNNFGNEAIYPACDKARIFAEMVGQKTLTRSNIETIKKLGFTINVEQQKL
jgi:hypothetical protein